MTQLNVSPDAATGTTTAKEVKQKVYVVTIDDVFDWDKEYHQPRVFSKKEDAIRYIKESYEEINDACYEYDEDTYIFDYEEGCCYACIYDDEEWAITHWEISMDECEIDNVANNRMRTVSYGKDKPALSGAGETNWRQNRRGVPIPMVMPNR
jgi:hypothetical protein